MSDTSHTPGSLPDTPWRELPPKGINYVIPSRIQAMMTGAVSAKQDNNGRITLEYEDHTTETALCPDFELLVCESFFTVVDMVQERARSTIAKAVLA